MQVDWFPRFLKYVLKGVYCITGAFFQLSMWILLLFTYDELVEHQEPWALELALVQEVPERRRWQPWETINRRSTRFSEECVTNPQTNVNSYWPSLVKSMRKCRTRQLVLNRSHSACVHLVDFELWWLVYPIYASLLLYHPSIGLRCDSVSQIAIDAHFNYIQMALQMGNIDKRIAGVVEGYLSVQETNTGLSLLAHVCSVLSKLGINHSQWLFSSRSKQQRVQYQGFSRCICAL